MCVCVYIFYIYMFIWLSWVLIEAHETFSCGIQTFSCGIWDPVPQPGIEPGPPALEAWSLSHWTTMEVPLNIFLKY